MDSEKRKLVYGNASASASNQAKIYTIIGTLLAALGVMATVSTAAQMPLWQEIVMIVLSVVTGIAMLALWIPSLWFSVWLLSKRRALRGFNLDDEHKMKVEMIDITKTMDFDAPAENEFKNKYETEMKYTMDFKRDIRFLSIALAFKNSQGTQLEFNSTTVDLVKKRNELILNFDFSNRKQVVDNIIDDHSIPLIEGHCQMKFDLKSKKLERMVFNKDADIITHVHLKK